MLPLPPDPSLVSRAGGPDALQVTVRSPAKSDVVEAYYRQMFKTGGWHLVSDAKERSRVDAVEVHLSMEDVLDLFDRIIGSWPSSVDGLLKHKRNPLGSVTHLLFEFFTKAHRRPLRRVK